MGGLVNRMKKKRGDDENTASGRSTFFTTTTEVLKATASATPNDVAIPAGFKPR
jgi:hypothetical protein